MKLPVLLAAHRLHLPLDQSILVDDEAAAAARDISRAVWQSVLDPVH